jgi:hypothetical protein
LVFYSEHNGEATGRLWEKGNVNGAVLGIPGNKYKIRFMMLIFLGKEFENITPLNCVILG